MINVEEKVEQFKKLPLWKQSAIAVAVVSVIVTLVSNYDAIRGTVTDLVNKYKENDAVKEFLKDAGELFKPVTDKFNTLLNREVKGE